MGQLWEDPANQDDVFVEQEMHLVVGKPVQLVIGAKDVIHDVGLVHFRMKMDAVPVTPTSMWFTPKFTTKEMKEKTGNPDFVYELSCDQMCGKGHWSMRGVIVVLIMIILIVVLVMVAMGCCGCYGCCDIYAYYCEYACYASCDCYAR